MTKKTDTNTSGEGGDAQPKYLTQEDFDKAISEKLAGVGGLTSEEKTGLFQWIQAADTIFKAIDGDPEIKGKVQNKINTLYGNQGNGEGEGQGNGGNSQGVQNQQQNQNQGQNNNAPVSDPKVKEVDERVTNVEKAQRSDIVKKFEQKMGIANLPEEKANEARKLIANKMVQWGHRLDTVPLTALEGMMSDAYLTAAPERLKEEGRLDGIIAARGSEAGNMPSMVSGGSPTVEQGGEFSAKQNDFMTKMGVDAEHAKEVIQETKQD